jgi:hypothetical protein
MEQRLDNNLVRIEYVLKRGVTQRPFLFIGETPIPKVKPRSG